MNWLEIMEVLDKMPRHLLKEEAELWHYDDEGNVELLPVHHVVSPLDGDTDMGGWEPGGDYTLSLQSFDEKRETKPKLDEYTVKIHRVCNVSVMAENEEQAKKMGDVLAGGYTQFACDNVNEAMISCDDEFCGIGTPDDHVSLSFDAEGSKRLLEEE